MNISDQNKNRLGSVSWATLFCPTFFTSDATKCRARTACARPTRLPLVFCVAIISTSVECVAQQPKVCTDIKMHLKQHQLGHTSKDFEINWDYRKDGMDEFYLHLDIDNDGIDDSVMKSCGASFDAVCRLVVDLSSEKNFELILEGERFFLARIKSSVYAVVGETSEPEEKKHGKRRVYQLTKQAIKLICPHI